MGGRRRRRPAIILEVPYDRWRIGIRTWLKLNNGPSRRTRALLVYAEVLVSIPRSCEKCDRLFAGQMASAFLLNSLCPTAFVSPLPRRSFLGARLLLPPPPPFPVQPYVSHHPPYERDSSFVGMRICVPLAPAFLVASDAGLCPCPPPPLPNPWSSSSGSGSALIGQVAVIGRSVGDPAPRARARARLPCLLPTGPVKLF